MLLRPDLQLWPVVPVPDLVRVPSLQGKVSTSVVETDVTLRDFVAERDRFLAFIRGRIRDADAEDIFQKALIKASRHVGTLRDPSQARAWFFRIVRRTLADHHAEWARREAKLAELASDFEEATPEETAVCGCSLGQLEELRPEYADILRRVDVEDQPVAEAASELGISSNNATVRLFRARKALRDRLLASCGTDSMRACLSCNCD